MQIEFTPSPAPTVGIELELQLVDAATRRSACVASEVLDRLRGPDGGADPRTKHELFESMLEVVTGVCGTVGEARSDLEATLRRVLEVTDAAGLAVFAAGTHPFSHWQDLTLSPDPRYHTLLADLGWPVRRLAISGTHVHVGVPSGRHAIPIVHRISYHLPVFVALSASSPYWHGLDTDLASCRTKVFEGLPTAGLPPHVADWDDYRTFLSTLMGAGVIRSVRDVWWDVRPHPDFGTVELRMCDSVATLGETTAIAALAQCLVADSIERLDAGEPLPTAREWILRENKWLAARHGLDTSFLVGDDGTRTPAAEVTLGLVEDLRRVAERLGCGAELDAVGGIVAGGASSDRQRAVVAAGGTHADVVDSLVAGFGAGVPR